MTQRLSTTDPRGARDAHNALLDLEELEESVRRAVFRERYEQLARTAREALTVVGNWIPDTPGSSRFRSRALA